MDAGHDLHEFDRGIEEIPELMGQALNHLQINKMRLLGAIRFPDRRSAEPGSRETGADCVEKMQENKCISPAALAPGSALRLSGKQKQCRCCS